MFMSAIAVFVSIETTSNCMQLHASQTLKEQKDREKVRENKKIKSALNKQKQEIQEKSEKILINTEKKHEEKLKKIVGGLVRIMIEPGKAPIVENLSWSCIALS
jgi:FKBP-type peptidyl-prolyl cis-trans isomerase